jgi:hypothetical protein
MRKLAYILVLLCGSCWAQTTTTFWLDPDVSAGTHTGTTTNPWQTLNWTSINSALSTGPVVVNFSACPQTGCAGGTASQASTAGINYARTNYTLACAGSTTICTLTLDGMSFWNPSDSSPPATWNSNVAAPQLCKWDAAGCAWASASRFTITAGSPFGSNGTVTNCEGGGIIQGFNFIATSAQPIDGIYLSNMTFQNLDYTAVGSTVGPGAIVGPGNNGPGKGGFGCAAQPAGGPDNITWQYNHAHNTFGECLYIGASTPDPVQSATPNQVTEDPGLGNCMPNCHTGDNYLIQGNVHESCATVGGQGDGIDVKDGHTNLRLLSNTIRTTKAGTGTAGNDGQCLVIESATRIEANYCEGTTFTGATNHDGIALAEGWNTAPGRGAVTVRNNMIVNETSGVGHNAGIDMFSPNVGSITVSALWSSVSIQNNSVYKTNDPCVEIEGGQAATITVENNIGSNCVGGNISGTVTTKDHNDWFSSGTPSGETSTITTDPKYVSTTLPGVDVNFQLQVGSGALGTGANLSGSFTTDYFGTARSVPWNMGFWQAAVSSTPLIYFARTDLSPQPYPATIPCPSSLGCSGGGALNGSNYYFTPSDFPYTPVIRISDMATGGQSALHAGYTTSCDANSEVNIWNLNEDRFTICQSGNWQQLWAYNAVTKVATRSTSFVSPGVGTPAWSFTQPYIMYHDHPCPAATSGCTQNDPTIFAYDTTCAGGIATCNPTGAAVTVVVDLATACSISAIQVSGSSVANILVSGDDQTFGVVAGEPTDGLIYAITWNRTTGCSYWNTKTGQTFNGATLIGTITPSDRFAIHKVELTKGGTYLKVQEGGCISTCTAGVTNTLWQNGTANVTIVTSANSCGHTAAGYNYWVNKCSGVTDANGLFKSALATPNTQVSLPAAYPSPDEGNQAHVNWANDTSGDNQPFVSAMEFTGFTPNYAWSNEILGVATDGTGRVWRLLHHYVSLINVQAFIPAGLSPSGSKLLWTTDWDSMLGCTNGTSVGCTPSGPDWTLNNAYAANALINPSVGNTGSGGFGYTFQSGGSCTSGATEPATWNQTISGTTTDNTCTWTNLGTPRNDVFLALLPVSGPAPALPTFTMNGQVNVEGGISTK